MITRAVFDAALDTTEPPVGANHLQHALWAIHQDQWELAHTLVQDDAGSDAAWIHALLHRIEGDLRNAAYWYRRADRSECTTSTDAEWAAQVAALVGS